MHAHAKGWSVPEKPKCQTQATRLPLGTMEVVDREMTGDRSSRPRRFGGTGPGADRGERGISLPFFTFLDLGTRGFPLAGGRWLDILEASLPTYGVDIRPRTGWRKGE